MKSAWELALEKTGGSLDELPPEKKKQLHEIDTVYRAKNVAADIAARERIGRAGGDQEEISRIMEDLAVEKASNDSKMNQEKEKIRRG